MIVRLPAFANLPTLGPTWPKAFAEMCVRNGWDPTGILVVLYFETGGTFDPSIQLQTTDTKTGERGPCLSLANPKNCAVGLLQWNRDGAKASGLPAHRSSLEKIVAMTGEEQLPLIEKFFQTTLGRTKPSNPADYYLPVLGRADTVGSSDWTVVYSSTEKGGSKASNRAYQSNKGLDGDGDGAIRVGDMREVWRATLAKAKGQTIAVSVVEPQRPTIKSNFAPAASVGLGLVLLGVLAFRRAA